MMVLTPVADINFSIYFSLKPASDLASIPSMAYNSHRCLLLLLYYTVCSSFQTAWTRWANEDGLKPGLSMVNNLDWTKNKNMMAYRMESISKDPAYMSNHAIPGMSDAKMSFFYGMGSPNMQIKFHWNKSAKMGFCEVGVLPVGCEYKTKKRGYKYEANPRVAWRPTAFCPVPAERLTNAANMSWNWTLAEGTYEKPSKQPQCLYDVYEAAIKHDEYDLLSSCAKAYFFNGRDYTDPKRFWMREGWMLFLAEGRVTCEASGNVEADRELIARGYSLELVHLFDRSRKDYSRLCPQLEAKLVAYTDNRKDGRFFLAAVVGAGQLDFAKIEDFGSFWDEKSYKEHYAISNLHKRACYLLYNKLLFRNDDDIRVKGRWNLELRVHHHCTKRTLRETVSFDISVRNNPEGVHEDKGIAISIDMVGARLARTTGQVLCANGMDAPVVDSIPIPGKAGPVGCEPPIQSPPPGNWIPVDQPCPSDYECVPDTRCVQREGDQNTTCVPNNAKHVRAENGCDTYLNCDKFHSCYFCRKSVCSKDIGECRWWFMYEEDEPCLTSEECYPDHYCEGAAILIPKLNYGRCVHKSVQGTRHEEKQT